MQTEQTPCWPSLVTRVREGGLAKFRAALSPSASPQQCHRRDLECRSPDSPGHRSGQRSPRMGLSEISPPLAASVPAPVPPRRRCLLKQKGHGSQLLPTCTDHHIATSPADSVDLGITRKPRGGSPVSGFGTSPARNTSRARKSYEAVRSPCSLGATLPRQGAGDSSIRGAHT